MILDLANPLIQIIIGIGAIVVPLLIMGISAGSGIGIIFYGAMIFGVIMIIKGIIGFIRIGFRMVRDR